MKSRDPYFFLAFRRQETGGCPVADAIDIHLACERRGGTTAANPYSTRSIAFHITFYEMIQTVETVHDMHLGRGENTRDEDREKHNIAATESLVKTCEDNNIRVGHLYEKPRTDTKDNRLQTPRPRAFRQSAFTVYTIAIIPEVMPYPSNPSEKERWTAISLAPTSFFNNTDQWFAPDHNQGWPSDVVHGYSGAAVELYAIIKALGTVETRWQELERYISGLVVQDFMNPKEYCSLLFDDETFSRSRLYFWIIGFIIEVQPCIEDNITQWNLYQRARIQPLLEDPASRDAPGLMNTTDFERSSIDIIRQYDKEGKQIMQNLENLKKGFDAIAVPKTEGWVADTERKVVSREGKLIK
ncbi:hypothetical protein QBC45DRAFT_239534 [Copromyces sp. CBS 386.78]|nr:hypothetical protein QBC45DRAFT_239534 [Copromyces sp. CBS 386.78]